MLCFMERPTASLPSALREGTPPVLVAEIVGTDLRRSCGRTPMQYRMLKSEKREALERLSAHSPLVAKGWMHYGYGATLTRIVGKGYLKVINKDCS